MKPVVATAWIASATIPCLLAAVFIFGCCVLPFHKTIHQLMPLCQVAVQVLHGDHEHRGDQPAPPPEKKADPQLQLLTTLTLRHDYSAPATISAPRPDASPASYRSRISLGAVRCDEDVGLQLLLNDVFRL